KSAGTGAFLCHLRAAARTDRRYSEGQRAAARSFDDLTRNPARCGTSEERHHVGDIIRLADSLQRLLAERESLAVRGTHESGQVSFDHSGRYRIDRNGARTKLNRKGFRQIVEWRFQHR